MLNVSFLTIGAIKFNLTSYLPGSSRANILQV